MCVGFSATGYVDDVSIGGMSMDIDPRASGNIVVQLQLDDVNVDWSTVVSPGPDVDGDMSVDTIVVTAELVPNVSAIGLIYFTWAELTVVNTGFSFEASGPWDEIAGVVVDVEDLIWDEVREAIEEAVYDTVPDLLEDSLGDVRISEDFEVLDNVYSLLAKINAIDADADGISVHLATRMLPAVTYGVAADGTGPDGAPRYFHAPPTWDVSTSGTNLAVNTDFINQVLFAFFEGGLLNRTLTSDDLGIDMTTISLLMLADRYGHRHGAAAASGREATRG